MAESTTIPSMDTTKPEPIALEEALTPLAARLRAMGLEPGQRPDAPTPIPKETEEDAHARHQARVEHLAARWKSLVPALFREADVEDLDEDQSPVRVRYWLRSGSLHLVLAGAPGTGKTHAAYAVGNQALGAGMWVEAWAVGDLMDALRPGSSDHGADARARCCQVLILDDLTAKATEWEAERMTLLLDARVRERLQTVITTNITRQQIDETWGSRFLDRLSYRLTAVTFKGESRRHGAWA